MAYTVCGYPSNHTLCIFRILPIALAIDVVVRLSVRLFPLYLLKRLTFELAFLCVSHDNYSSPDIEGQGHKSTSSDNAVGVVSI